MGVVPRVRATCFGTTPHPLPPPPQGGGEKCNAYCITGIENCAPSFTPDGQRWVTVLVLV